MENIIQWLMKIENLAYDIYSQAAAYFEDERKLQKFLVNVAEDEASHYDIMGKASRQYLRKSYPPQVISVDIETQNKIERILTEIQQQLVLGSLTEQVVLEQIMTAEFSEWNDIFVYVVSYLKEQADEFKYAVAEIQNHRRFIENFIEEKGYGQELLKKIRQIPAVWTENILIVEDDPMVSGLIKAILRRDGNIDTVGNGKEAIRKITEKYYKLVISDVDMPVLDGLSFYKEIVKMFPGLRDRFMFITGDHSPERLDFFKRNHLPYLLKPASITVIRNEALKILLS